MILAKYGKWFLGKLRAQRVKLAAELGELKRSKHNLYILDEHTTGLHFADLKSTINDIQATMLSGSGIIIVKTAFEEGYR